MIRKIPIYNYFTKYKIKHKLKKKFIFFYSKNLNNLKDCKIIFILGYTKKLNITYLKRFQYSLIVHESDLPKGKGFSPVKYQILENKSKINISLIKCDNKIDSGDIFEKSYFIIKPTDIYDEIKKKQFLATKRIIVKFLNKYPKVKTKKQKGKSTFYRKLTSKDDEINPKKSIFSQFNLLRSTDYNKFTNYFFTKKKFYIKIHKKNINYNYES